MYINEETAAVAEQLIKKIKQVSILLLEISDLCEKTMCQEEFTPSDPDCYLSRELRKE